MMPRRDGLRLCQPTVINTVKYIFADSDVPTGAGIGRKRIRCGAREVPLAWATSVNSLS
jgi:hypothetical protein